jgi:hypothetical protein
LPSTAHPDWTTDRETGRLAICRLRTCAKGGLAVYQSLFGGDGSQFIVATLAHDFADLDKGPAMRLAYGAERAAAIQKTLTDVVAHVERTVVREVPDLGFRMGMSNENR